MFKLFNKRTTPSQPPRPGSSISSRNASPAPAPGPRPTGSGVASRPATPGPGGTLHAGSGSGGRPPSRGGQPQTGSRSHPRSPSRSSGASGGTSAPGTSTAGTSTAGTSVAGNAVNGLEELCILVQTGDSFDPLNVKIVPLGEESALFLAVAAAINLGLSLLESETGKEALSGFGFLAVDAWQRSKVDHIFPVAPSGFVRPYDIEPHVTTYLQRMRRSFPPILLTNRASGEGQTDRLSWARTKNNQPERKYKDYVGFEAGRLRLNKFVFENIVEASKQLHNEKLNPAMRKRLTEAYENRMVLMAVTVAHALCHLFIGFLSGYGLPDTVADLRHPAQCAGDTGRWERCGSWDGDLIGGNLFFFTEELPNKSRPEPHLLGYQQAGNLWLWEIPGGDMRVVKREYIKRFLNFDFSPDTLPFKGEGGCYYPESVGRTRLVMSEMRNLALGKALDYDPADLSFSKQELESYQKLKKRLPRGVLERLRKIPSTPMGLPMSKQAS